MRPNMLNKIIFIVGPTATGKTKTAVELAKLIDGEIISCDSMQIYKHMPIITQTPSRDELEEIPHYLIQELMPEKEYSAAEFSNKECIHASLHEDCGAFVEKTSKQPVALVKITSLPAESATNLAAID